MHNRRDLLKLSGAAALGLLAPMAWAKPASPIRPLINVAGYSYDRVQAIKDGNVGLDQADVSFHDINIYRLNDLAFGPEKTYELPAPVYTPYDRHSNDLLQILFLDQCYGVRQTLRSFAE